LREIPAARPADLPSAPEYLGLALISCGIVALVMAIWQYQWTLRYLWSGSFASIAGMTEEGKKSPVVAVAVLLILVGLFAFLSVLLRLT
jgi:putative membrane protein